MTHKELVEIAYRWVLSNARCGIAFKELVCAANGETPDVIGFSSWAHSVLIECKTSKSDFYKDKNKTFRKDPSRGMGKYRFYICPENMIKVEQLPEKWGLIYVNKKGKAILIHDPLGVKRYRGEEKFKYNLEAEHQLLYSALRRLFIQGHAPKIYNKAYERISVNQIIERNKNNQNEKEMSTMREAI